MLETRERNEWASSMNYFIANLYSKIITVASVFSPGRNEKKISNNFRIFAMVYAFISRYKKIIHRKNLKKWLFLLIYQACYIIFSHDYIKKNIKNLLLFFLNFHQILSIFLCVIFFNSFRIDAIIKLITII